MIVLYRNDPRSLHDQLQEQIRYLVASGRLKPGESMPSTRRLADQVGVSFHTVRKAYAALADAGVIVAHGGSAYRVAETAELPRSERLESGAAVVQEALRRLVSLGLDEEEISYLFEEQLELESAEDTDTRIVFVDEYTEAAEYLAAECSRAFGRSVEPATLVQAGSLTGVEYALTPLHCVRDVIERLPRADVIGVQVALSVDACAAAARLFEHQAVLLAVRYQDAVGPLSRQLRTVTGFGGQLIATVMDDADARIGTLVRQCDVFLYSISAARRARAHLGSAPIHHPVHPAVAPTELERVRLLLPR